MAKRIKETPIVKGKDAVIFLNEMKMNENKKVSIEVANRINENFKKLQSISKF